MNKTEKDKLHKEMTRTVREAYVNYSRPDSQLLQYFNDMGLVAFSKYAIRINLAVRDLLRGKPLKFATAAIVQELFEGATGINLDDIVEHSWVHKPINNWIYSPGAETILTSVLEPQLFTYMKQAL